MKPQGPVNRRLMKEMSVYFPSRWEVSGIAVRLSGNRASGTIKIHCSADDKTFMSDFEAVLDAKRRVSNLALDGVVVKGKLGCPEDPEPEE